MGDDIRAPVPDGYCEPRGSYVDNAQMAAAADTQNVTFVTFMNCREMDAGGDLSHFIYIKAPRGALSQRVTLAELLEGMGSVPESELAAAVAGDSIDSEVSRDVETVVGRDVEIKTDIKPASKDAYAYYLAGTIRLGVAEGPQTASGVAIALTSVKGHILSYNTYAPGADLSAVRAALAEARREVRRLIEANP